MIKKKSLYSSR